MLQSQLGPELTTETFFNYVTFLDCDVNNRRFRIDILPVVSQMVYLTLLLATRALVVNFSNEVPR
jgi:hypothetical protein